MPINVLSNWINFTNFTRIKEALLLINLNKLENKFKFQKEIKKYIKLKSKCQNKKYKTFNRVVSKMKC